MEHTIEKNKKPCEPEWEIKCAGMPYSLHEQVTFDNFGIPYEYWGKLQINHVAGGIVLTEGPFKIRGIK